MRELYIKDVTFSHCEYSNNPLPPKTLSKHIKWIRDREGPAEDTVYTDMFIHHCNGGIGWLIEPRELIPAIYDYVKYNQEKFKQVWTHDKDLYTSLPNHKVRIVPFGGCWIDNFDYGVHPKTKNFSIIASGKRELPGHKLRHTIVQAADGNIDLFGNGYQPIRDKIEGLRDYRFHFAIENSKKDYWFTEKLIDCLMTGTIPIYWGCPSIGDFFDTNGFILFNDLNELKVKLEGCTPEFYESKRASIEHNFRLAQKHLLAEDWIYARILQ